MENETVKRESERLERQRKSDRMTVARLLGSVAGLFAVALLAGAFLIACGGDDDEPSGGAQPAEPVATQPASPPAEDQGADLFAASCGSCHTLAAADTSGTVGPNLDDVQPDEAATLAAIENGGRGAGAMPANLLTGADAQQVAAFVAANAGR